MHVYPYWKPNKTNTGNSLLLYVVILYSSVLPAIIYYHWVLFACLHIFVCNAEYICKYRKNYFERLIRLNRQLDLNKTFICLLELLLQTIYNVFFCFFFIVVWFSFSSITLFGFSFVLFSFFFLFSFCTNIFCQEKKKDHPAIERTREKNFCQNLFFYLWILMDQ